MSFNISVRASLHFCGLSVLKFFVADPRSGVFLSLDPDPGYGMRIKSGAGMKISFNISVRA